MSPDRVTGVRASARFLFLLVVGACPALAQDAFVTPGPNVNVVGLTPKLEYVPDFQLKQQQEPSCIVRPGNESFYFCAFNDLRASDLPIQGDGWIGVGYSNDFAETFSSRLMPGYLGDPNGNSIGYGFAADPTAVAIPGNSPGLAIVNYIAGFRESSDSALVIQRWVENPQEDQDFWRPEDGPRIITTSLVEGGFIDKPNFKYVPEDPVTQGEISQLINIEGETDPAKSQIQVTTPTGTLIVVYGVFPDGSEGSILRLRRSQDNGETWSDAVELVNSPTPVNGASIAIAGDKIVIIYRQAGGEIVVERPRRSRDDDDDDCDDDDDDDDSCTTTTIETVPDAVVAVACDNATNIVCTEGQQIFENCPFDQPSSGSTFRTTAFPWIAYDGRRLWAFQADRNPGGACVAVDGAPGFFEGKPRIVALSSVNGTDWVGSAANPAEPIVIAPRSEGFQVMPVGLGVKGKTWVAWTDTFREEFEGLPPGASNVLLGDYTNGVDRVFRKADVWATRLEHSCSSTNVTAGCTPDIEAPVRVSQYRTVMETLQAEIAFEIQADFKNLRTHVSGTQAFGGDYKALAAVPARQLANGRWISNELPGGSKGPERPGFTDSQNVFVAWGDNRDVVGEFQSDPSNPTAFPYTPPINSPANPGGAVARFEDIDPDDIVPPADDEMLAFDEPDHAPGVPLGGDLSTCVPGNQSPRSRDANVYASLIEDRPSLVAPTPVKPLGSIQRMYALELRNTDPDNDAAFCLAIENQPPDFAVSTGLASFFQLPAIGPFSDGDQIDLLTVGVPAGSGASRSVFVTTSDQNTIITVNAYEGACPTEASQSFGSFLNAIRVGNGLLFDPEFCETNVCDPVALNETHDITLANPGIQAPGIQAPVSLAPGIQAPGIQAPGIQAPGIQALGFLAPGIQAPGIQAPGIQAPSALAFSLKAPGIQAPSIMAPGIQAPGIQAPGIQATALADAIENNPQDVIYQDVTYVVSADGNVTTTYSADIAINGLPGLIASNPADVEAAVQFIAWTNNVFTSVSNDDPCLAAPGASQQILAYRTLDAEAAENLTLPFTIGEDQQQPYLGDLSYTGSPDKDIALTVRFWATGAAKDTLEQLEQDLADCRADPFCDSESGEFGAARLISFGASAHQCSTDDAVVNTQVGRAGSTPEDCLTNDEEKIIPDLAPPIISVPASVIVEATGPGGAIVTYTVSATDNLDSNPELSCDPDSGTQFVLSPLGTSVSCFASDFKGNSTISTFDVFVVDTTSPELADPPDIVAEATSSAGAVVTFANPAASDIVDTDVEVNCSPASGATFAVGATQVECTATDDSGNTDIKTFSVNVSDTTAPTFPAAAPDLTVEATEAGGAIPNYALPAAVDDVDSSPSVTCTPGPTELFAIGTTAVSCTATDSAANTSLPLIFNVTVSDTTAPALTMPGEVTVQPRVAGDPLALTYAVDATGNVVVEANQPPPAGAIITFSATATDAVNAAPAITCVPPSGATFPLGTTAVACTASDGLNISAEGTIAITIEDTIDPVFNVDDGTSFTFEANSPQGAEVDLAGSGAVVATDRGADLLPVCVATSADGLVTKTLPDFLEAGDWDVTCTVDGSVLTTVSVTVRVDVIDVVPPVLNIPGATLTVDADPLTGTATVNFLDPGEFGGETITATDNVDTDVEITCTPASGTTFNVLPIGESQTITCTAADDGPRAADDNGVNVSDPVSFELVVRDLEPPTVPLPTLPDPTRTDIFAEATSASGATVSFDVTSSDIVDSSPDVVCTPSSGSVFPIGSNEVSCTATDFWGNTSSGSFFVTVADTTPPDILPPTDVVAEATDTLTPVAIGTATASDTVSAVSVSSNAPPAFPVGTTTVVWTATDASGNSATALQTVTITDVTPPELSGVPAGFDNVEATERAGAQVTWPAPTATDLVDKSVPVTCSPSSGSTFALGTTTVTCSATDQLGNSASAMFDVSVVDTTPPHITVPHDISVSSASQDGASVAFDVSATDIFDVTTACVDQTGGAVQSGDVFPVGTTTVTCTATDANGNEASDSFNIEVLQALGIRLIVPKKSLKAGSTNPIDWQYLDPSTGHVIASGFLSPTASWRGPYSRKHCRGSTSGAGNGDDAGGSDIRYSGSSRTWQLSWKTPNMKGYFKLFITPPGESDPDAVACVRLR
ncbi:MAG: HYR domain-containing protein [Woeseiaceae bacterium]|nr:HYR domain-containing protein [Woeseiaceae bacterium]